MSIRSQNLSLDNDRQIDRLQSLPFAEFYLLLVRSGRQKLSELLASSQLALLSKVAYEDIERSLLIRLVDICTPSLILEFDRFRDAAVDNLDGSAYDRFIADLSSSRIALFADYPILSQIVDQTIDLWVESIREFIERLHDDIAELAITFNGGRSLGILQRVVTDLGDRHHDGKAAFLLTFESAVRIVYKPKDLSVDLAFDRLLDWCNATNISLPFRLLKILAKHDYGWQEFVEQQPCEHQAAVQNFYRRSGMMLALLFLLGAKDGDRRYLVASGEHPVLIDADILLCPQVKAENWFDDSVLQVGWLPRWNGNVYTPNALDSSAIGDIFPKQTNSAWKWEFINTDRMRLVKQTGIVPAGKNAVILDGKTVSPKHYVEQIVTGFEEIARLFIDRQLELFSETSPLTAFANCRSRVYLRSPSDYRVAFRHGLNPEHLRSDAEYRVLIHRILTHQLPASLAARTTSEQERALQAEARALQQQDIPYFSARGDSTDLAINRETIVPNFFEVNGYQRSIERIRNFDADNLALQIVLIRSSFAAKYAHTVGNDASLQGELPGSQVLSSEELQQEAISIGHDLINNAIWDGSGCNWIEFAYMVRANRYQLNVLDDSLYTGRAGVSIFLAALAKLSGDRQFHDVALGALDPFRRSIAAGEVRSEILESKFGLLGLGGTIYSMVKVSQFLQEPSLLDSAVYAAQLLTPGAIATDRKLDVIWGATGAILGLLSLYQATQDRSVLDIAINCGNHLLSTRTTTIPRAWITMEDESSQPLTGFSHGAAGITMGLIRLYGATGDREFLVAAQEGIAYERSVFDEAVQNWPDFRMAEQRDKIDYLNVWCHGSAGIGLARLGSWSVLKEPEIRRDIDIALSTSQKNGIFDRGFDHLCCGNVGRIELMVVGSQLLDDLQLLETARESITKMIVISKESGAYGLLPHLPDAVFSPSFYRGVAGVGYQLLRAIDPTNIRSVALWE
jgi:type 2 lantibiotic biosynthesis protein LanM